MTFYTYFHIGLLIAGITAAIGSLYGGSFRRFVVMSVLIILLWPAFILWMFVLLAERIFKD